MRQSRSIRFARARSARRYHVRPIILRSETPLTMEEVAFIERKIRSATTYPVILTYGLEVLA